MFIEANLPKTLNTTETIEHFKRFKNGDSNSREILINHNIRLVIHRVKTRFFAYEYDKDELVSIGIIGLIKAVDSFCLDKDISFSTYASTCIDNEILMFIQKNKRHKTHISLDEPMFTDKDGNEILIKDTLKSDEENIELSYETKEKYEEISQIIETLPEREKQIIMLYFGFDCDPHTQNEIALKFNISQSYVSRIIMKVSQKVKNKLENSLNANIGKDSLKTIYEYFSKYSKEEVDAMLAKLSDKDRELIRLRYGDDLEHPVTDPSWSKEKSLIFYGTLYYKMKTILEGKTEKKVRRISYNKRTVKTKSIYEYFSEYSKEEVDAMLAKLSDKDKELIRLRYGDDLEHPVTKLNWSKQDSNSFYGRLCPKMKRLLSNQGKGKKRLSTIYEYFSEYSKDEIDAALGKLNDRDKELIRLRYGDDLEHPVTDPSWSKKYNSSFYGCLCPKMKRLLSNQGKGKKRLSTIYEYFSEYSKDEIDAVLDKLNDRDKELIRLRYGDDLEHPVTDPTWSQKDKNSFYVGLCPKMKRLLLLNRGKTVKRGKRLSTIYEYFSEYSKDEIDAALSKLNDRDKELIRLRYGDDLEHPVTDPSWSQKDKNTFYKILVHKIRSLLKKNRMNCIGKTIQLQNDSPSATDKTSNEIKNYKRIKVFLNSSLFADLTKKLSVSSQDAVIFFLKIMTFNGENFSSEFIANCLNISESEADVIAQEINDFVASYEDLSLKLKND